MAVLIPKPKIKHNLDITRLQECVWYAVTMLLSVLNDDVITTGGGGGGGDGGGGGGDGGGNPSRPIPFPSQPTYRLLVSLLKQNATLPMTAPY